MQRTIEYYMSFPVIAIVAFFMLCAMYNWAHEKVTGIKNVGKLPWEY